MAGDAKKLQPIIIKRIKKGGHAVHGGAWKIAYADFVTAMMAFFLLMWLLGSTTEGDKKGIADYFAAPLKVAMGGGSGSGDSSHVVKGGGEDLTRSTGQVKRGDVQAPRSTMNLHKLKEEQIRAEVARLEDLKEKIEGKLKGDDKLAGLLSQLVLDMTDDGLRIQIVDAEKRAMFASGSAVVQTHMRELLRELGAVLAEVPNRLTLEGHTDAMPFGSAGGSAGSSGGGGNEGRERGYSNWELSADRANASRRELVAGGLPEDQVLRVQGLAASSPFDRTDATAPSNRRISLVVMTRAAEDEVFRASAPRVPAPESSPSVPPQAPPVPAKGSPSQTTPPRATGAAGPSSPTIAAR